jgi:hypothetical protein
MEVDEKKQAQADRGKLRICHTKHYSTRASTGREGRIPRIWGPNTFSHVSLDDDGFLYHPIWASHIICTTADAVCPGNHMVMLVSSLVIW